VAIPTAIGLTRLPRDRPITTEGTVRIRRRRGPARRPMAMEAAVPTRRLRAPTPVRAEVTRRLPARTPRPLGRIPHRLARIPHPLVPTLRLAEVMVEVEAAHAAAVGEEDLEAVVEAARGEGVEARAAALTGTNFVLKMVTRPAPEFRGGLSYWARPAIGGGLAFLSGHNSCLP